MRLEPPSGRRPPSYGPLVAIGAVGMLFALVAGRLSADLTASSATADRPARAEPAARTVRTTSPATAPRERPAHPSTRLAEPPPAATASAPSAAPASELAPPAVRHLRPTPELVARVTQEASVALEQTRAQLVERCQAAGSPSPRSSGARFTFNVTFDASGREIARGINEDRRFRAPPEIARCVRSLPAGSLRVSPPGTNVGVRVAMMFP